MVGPVNVKKIYAKCQKKKFGQLHDQSDGQFGQFGQFCRHFGYRGVNIKKLKIMGSVMILRENVKKMMIQKWA